MSQSQKMNILYKRTWKTPQGEERIEWMRLGTCWRGDRGDDIVLYAMPPANEKGEFRFITRPDNYQERQAAQQQGQGGQQRGGLNPQHRDDFRRQREPGDDDEAVRTAFGDDPNQRIPF